MAPLPEKYEILAKHFEYLVTLTTLSQMKRSSSPFINISRKIESDREDENAFRRITYGHLAQLKHILPRAIEIRRVNAYDKLTSCMKPELYFSINVDAVENDGNLDNERWKVHLRRELRLWLEKFSRSHPKGDEIPEELLPEPFNRKELDRDCYMTTPTSFPTKKTLTELRLAISDIRDDEIAEGDDEIAEGDEGLNSNINNSPNMSFTLEQSIEPQRKQQPVEARAHLPPSSVLPGPESPLIKSSSEGQSSSAAGTPSPSKPENKRQKRK